MTRHRTARRLAPLLLLATLAGCFEEPVRDDLELRFDPESGVEVELVTTFRLPGGQNDNAALQARVAERRRRIQNGEDDWSARFEALHPGSRRTVLDWENGELTEARQSAQLDLGDDSDALERFFADTLVNATYTAEDGWAELSIAPLAAGRATRRQRQLYDRALAPWTEAVADYFDAAATLYSYLEDHTDRSKVTLGVLLADALPGVDEDELRAQLLAEEKPLVDAVEDAMDSAAEILLIDNGEAYSINEISRLLYDPFPARIRIHPAGTLLETEGFEDGGDGRLEIRGISLWEALESLQGVWLDPDPLLLYIRLSGGITGDPAPEVTLDEIAARDRYAATPPPAADEIRAGIDERLRPEPIYRAVWATER